MPLAIEHDSTDYQHDSLIETGIETGHEQFHGDSGTEQVCCGSNAVNHNTAKITHFSRAILAIAPGMAQQKTFVSVACFGHDRIAIFGKLASVQTCVIAVLREQLRMVAALDYPSLIHHQDQIGFLDGCKAMGDNQRRTTLHNRIQGSLNMPFRFGV